MLIYNITYSVPHEICQEWLNWMKEEHIPEVLATGHFERHQLLKLLELDESESLTYACQFFAQTEGQYRSYISESAPGLRLKANQRWGDQVIGFRTLMGIVK